MWVLNYLACLAYGHYFIDITWKHAHHQYCLRCGKVELHDVVRESVLVGDHASKT